MTIELSLQTFTLSNLLQFLIVLVALKALTIGSDFNIATFLSQPKEYWYWYKSRQTFKQHLAMNIFISSMSGQIKRLIAIKLTDEEEN
jgi:hypothetical protein